MDQSTDAKVWLQRWEKAKKNPWPFLKYFVCTFDEHEFSQLALEKPFPWKAMYRVIVRVWFEFDVIFIEKSRQIMLSWIMAALFLWMAMFFPAKRIFFQSKKQDDSNHLLDRARHIYERLLKLNLPNLPKAKMTKDKVGTTTRIEFPEIKSEIWAIPQGPDVYRSYTTSGILCDESEFQREFLDAWTAAMPTIAGGAKAVFQSTVNGRGPVYFILHGVDETTHEQIAPHRVDSSLVTKLRFNPPEHLSEEEARRWREAKVMALSDEEFAAIPIEEIVAEIPGMQYWETEGGTHSLRIHHSSDPDKDPKTETGRQFCKDIKIRMPLESRRRREYDMDRDAFVGRPVIGNWDENIFVKTPEYKRDVVLDLSFDFGTILGVTLIAQYARIEKFNAYQLRFLDEVLAKNSDTPTLMYNLIERLTTNFRPSWDSRRIRSYCDPNGGRQQDTTSDRSENTSIKIVESASNDRIMPISRKFGCKESTEVLETVFAKSLPDGQPAIIVHERCHYLRTVFANLHYPEDGKDGHYEKDGWYDHGGDAARYMVNNIFDETALAGRQPEQTEIPRIEAIRQPTTGRIIGYRRRPSRRTQLARSRGMYVN